MAREKTTFFDMLVSFPWWISLILAGAAYAGLKYWASGYLASRSQPGDVFGSILMNGLAQAAPSFAPIAALILTAAAIVSFIASWKKRALVSKQKDIHTLRQLTWKEFEEMVGEVYRQKGYSVTETGGGGADGGIDLVLRKGGEKTLVQCKAWKKHQVSVKTVRELLGVCVSEKAARGIVITSGKFTSEAQEFAKTNPIELVDGYSLLELIKNTRNKNLTSSVAQDPDAPPACPLCGNRMVLRTSKKSQDKKFWGCPSFPQCRETRAYKV